MLNLSVLTALPTARVTIRGTEVEVRSLSASEVSAMESQCQQPPIRGRTESEREVFAADPSYQDRWRRYLRLQMYLRAGVSAGIVGKSGGWSSSMTSEQATAYADEIGTALTDAEIGAIDAARNGIGETRASDIGTADQPGN